MSHDTLTTRYEFLLTELQRVLSTRGKWRAMPALLDELHHLRELARLQAQGLSTAALKH